MFDWDKMKPVREPRTAEELFKEQEERKKIIIRIKKKS